MKSIQKVLTRLRAPRVKITYDVETGGATVQRELPFIVGIISDLSGDTVLPPIEERKFVYLDADNFSDYMVGLKTSLNLSVDNLLNPAPAGADGTPAAPGKLAITLDFKSMDDFNPDNILKNVTEMLKVYDQRAALVDLAAKLDGNDALESLMDTMVTDSATRGLFTADADGKSDDKIKPLIQQANMIKDDSQFERAKELLIAYANVIGTQTEIKDLYGFLLAQIAEIDTRLSAQMDVILHDPKFQALEGRWRGLWYLLYNTEVGEYLKLRVLCATRADIQKDLDKAAQFDQSKLFKKIYEDEFGTFGGTPYSVMLGDFTSFGRDHPDVDLLSKITTVCASAHVPFLGGASPELFGMNTYSELGNPRDIAKIFESTELAEWNGFRDIDDSRYCALFLPRVLARMPYGPSTNPITKFNYTEKVNGTDNTTFLWSNPAYAMAAKITQAFADYHWTAAIRGVEGGGLVEQLPVYNYKTAEGDVVMKCPTEIPLTDRREKELSDQGFIALCHAKGTNTAAFFGGQTVQKPKEYSTDDATANANLSARLPYMLTASRFAHYIKMMMRDKIGSMEGQSQIQALLQQWLAEYVLLSDDASQEMKASYPLRSASVEVIEDESNPGAYKAILFLKPHFQLEDLDVSLRLVATLPKKS